MSVVLLLGSLMCHHHLFGDLTRTGGLKWPLDLILAVSWAKCLHIGSHDSYITICYGKFGGSFMRVPNNRKT